MNENLKSILEKATNNKCYDSIEYTLFGKEIETFVKLLFLDIAHLCINENPDPRDSIEQIILNKIINHFEINLDNE
jgi:hypothetical protein